MSSAPSMLDWILWKTDPWGLGGWEICQCILRLVEEGGTWWHSDVVLHVLPLSWYLVLMRTLEFHGGPRASCDWRLRLWWRTVGLRTEEQTGLCWRLLHLKLWGKTNHKPWRSTPLILFRSIAGAKFETSNPKTVSLEKPGERWPWYLAAVARVTACNLAKVPLSKASLDVAIFCLALMGTDWTKFVAEVQCNCCNCEVWRPESNGFRARKKKNCQARRCLKPGGLGPGGRGKTAGHLHLSVLYGAFSAYNYKCVLPFCNM